jgi:hypothetical protein
VPEPHEEYLNVYDAQGLVIGSGRRREAKASGRAVGAINVLIINQEGQVLLQLRPADKENGALWDKSVGGHVSAGEDFDQAAVREATEELFDGEAGRVVLSPGDAQNDCDLRRQVVIDRVATQLNLRDVRHAPGGGLRNVLYHIGIYLGRTAVPLSGFRPQTSEITDLRYFTPAEIDAMLLRGELAPNMSFLWLSHAHRLLTQAS